MQEPLREAGSLREVAEWASAAEPKFGLVSEEDLNLLDVSDVVKKVLER
jgi:hypothetical protein